jgi:hypothetical protein
MKALRILVLLLTLHGAVARAADEAEEKKEADATEEAAPVEDGKGKPLEGVTVEALETYAMPKNNSLAFGFGLYPFNAYFTGFGLNFLYDYRLSKTVAWEIINASYVFSIGTDLTSQLAQDYGVNPQSIEKFQYLVSTAFLFTHTRGKLLFLDDYIKTFSSSFILGLGFLNTTAKSEVCGQAGISLEAAVSDSFTWRFEFRDLITVNGRNFAYFMLGTGVNF